ncbi:hypothetical protein, variant [Thecamonas trahens ATCC 50062]|uniref:Cux N-terminal domain-containing protein n=1 Tax=Thecamonas trahens ATCC 50062 TaxID=461836 RepID=A0A0L0D5M4_THETB|nr:hypothetical protein, variant [Thecamonas trahens ATCC 50062]KNC47644.1 hypothetical protein, variant [Thecamonas trahens ATCC 50062]|eukprot:XP_013759129.1 hypothetical protein, variant [Thecamonas trahens ATCC 50062]
MADEVAEMQSASAESKAALATRTRSFGKLDEVRKAKNVARLLKLYQDEIVALSERAESAEGHLLALVRFLASDSLPDPATMVPRRVVESLETQLAAANARIAELEAQLAGSPLPLAQQPQTPSALSAVADALDDDDDDDAAGWGSDGDWGEAFPSSDAEPQPEPVTQPESEPEPEPEPEPAPQPALDTVSLEEHNAAIEAARVTIGDLSNKLNLAAERIMADDARFDKLRTEYTQHLTAMQGRITELETAAAAACEASTDEVDELGAQVERLQSQLADAQAEIMKLNSALAAAESATPTPGADARVAELEERLLAAESQRDTAETAIDELESRIIELEELQEHASRARSLAESRAAELEAQLAARDEAAAAAPAPTSALSDDAADGDWGAWAADDEPTDPVSASAAIDADAELTQLREALTAANSELAELRDEVVRLNEALVAAQATHEQTLDEDAADADATDAELAELRDEVVRLNEALVAAQATHEQTLDDDAADADAADAELVQVREALAACQAELTKARDDQCAAVEEIARLHAALLNEQATHETTLDSHADLSTEVDCF